MNRTTRTEIAAFAGWLMLTGIAALAGSIASIQAAEFYGSLQQPAWAPPAWVFGPAWTLLYVLMAVAAWRIWRKEPTPVRAKALSLYVFQLALNALWSWMFFVWKAGGVAFAEMLLLIFCVLMLIRYSMRLDRVASWLLTPYAIWLGFAAMLNLSMWRLNPAEL